MLQLYNYTKLFSHANWIDHLEIWQSSEVLHFLSFTSYNSNTDKTIQHHRMWHSDDTKKNSCGCRTSSCFVRFDISLEILIKTYKTDTYFRYDMLQCRGLLNLCVYLYVSNLYLDWTILLGSPKHQYNNDILIKTKYIYMINIHSR